MKSELYQNNLKIKYPFLLLFIGIFSCQHDPIVQPPVDTGSSCDPSVIYFEKDVLPIITANCAYSGCHNAASKKDGIILDNYNNVIKTGKIKTGNASGSKLYEVMIDKDPKDVMPPPPATALNSSQLKIIADWINQGAKNEKCTETTNSCSVTNMSYVNNIKPILSSCTSCHKSGNTSGGVLLDTYQGVKSSISGGKLLGSISWASGFKPMPPGGSKMSDCNISKVKSWIDAGGLDN